MDNHSRKTEIQEQVDTTQVEIDRISNSLRDGMKSMTSYNSNCCIYRVPDYLLKGNEEFYKPRAILIGPKFYNTDENLGTIQGLKWTFLQSFIEHPDNDSPSFEPYIIYIKEKEREIRESYEEQFSFLSSEEFIQMIFLDVSFLVYLFLIQSKRKESVVLNAGFPFIENKQVPLMQYMQVDLFLEENQIPFFVCKGIYDIAFGQVNPCCTFLDLALECIGTLFVEFPESECIIDGEKITDASDIKHLLDLRRTSCCLLLDNERQMRSEEPRKFHPFGSAKQLSVAGVKFASSESSNPLDITFDKSNGVLKIPKFTLADSTEAAWRSIFVFEQFHYMRYDKLYFCDYVTFLDTLIDSKEDIELLQEKGIVDNVLGSSEEAAQLFNKITKNKILATNNFTFWDVSEGLKEYSSTEWNRWKAILWSQYFNHPWSIISFIAAVVIIILTILQTIAGFLQLSH